MKCEKIVGKGNTATVYEWQNGMVLKLFNKGYTKTAVEKEFNNAIAINDLNFSKPKAYEIVMFEDCMGIVYDYVEGEPLDKWVMKTQDLQVCAEFMAKLHKQIIHCSVSSVTSYKDFLKRYILKALQNKPEQLKQALSLLEQLPDGYTLCHGDFHPGNILILDGNSMVIDFMNVCRGNYLYDVARTVFLVEYTPVSADTKDKEMIMNFKKTLTDLYLNEMNVTREMIKDYLTLIKIARLGECPNE